jgi:UDP-N-acetylmuramoylalanine--D-glutamate ligase
MRRHDVSLAKREPLNRSDLAGVTVLIVGLAREGQAVARMLRRDVPTATLVGVDQRHSEAAKAWADTWAGEIPVVISEDGSGVPDEATVAVVSPGISRNNPLVLGLVERGIQLTSGTDLFMAEFGNRVIAVTGSKGKSTTAALIHHLLVAHGVDAVLGGNMGIPLWDVERADWIVAEVSSYQCHSLTHSPHTVALTSLFEEHLDWHGDVNRYFADKLNIIGHSPQNVIVNATQQRLVDEVSARHPDVDFEAVGHSSAWSVSEDEHSWKLTYRSEVVVDSAEVSFIGAHNAWNAAVACSVAETVVKLQPDIVATALRGFQPLANRLEPIPDPSGVVFLNDSLATNPPALAMALHSLRDKTVIALIGGFDRGVDDEAFLAEIVEHPVAALIGLPDSGATWLDRVQERLRNESVAQELWPQMVPVENMGDAVVAARRIAKPGDVVTLSPGAPSFGQYRDFQDRADHFIAAIHDTATN